MTENEREYVLVARQLIKDGKIEDACCHYYKAEEENADNLEAKFFGAYLGYKGLVEKHDNAALLAFQAMTKSLGGAAQWLKDNEGETVEKLVVLVTMASLYAPTIQYIPSHHLASSSSTIPVGGVALYKLGDSIVEEFGTEPAVLQTASVAWKEAVALQQKFYGYKYDGIKAEDYVAKIQKHDPSYTMPKKAGCISKG